MYLEPRLPDASAPTDEYQVVWLPQADFATAQHQSKCEPMSLGLARSGRRYGLRVTAKNFQQVFQKLKPDGQFLLPGLPGNVVLFHMAATANPSGGFLQNGPGRRDLFNLPDQSLEE